MQPQVPFRRDAARLHLAVVHNPAAPPVLRLVINVALIVAPDLLALYDSVKPGADGIILPPDEDALDEIPHVPFLTPILCLFQGTV